MMMWQRILTMDVHATTEVVTWLEKYLPLEQLKIHYQLLEISCHGLPWLIITLMLLIFEDEHFELQMNLLIGLLLDIAVIGTLKAIVKRKRPAPIDDPLAVGPDVYSFPSGHASRSAYLVYFFLRISPIALIYIPPLLAWSFYVCMSRLLLKRHYIFDVYVGVLLGVMEGLFVHYIYLDRKTCTYAIHKVTKLFGLVGK
ncbi:phospholipid phosphatase 6-like isoform X2 [Pseudomyrmex gracilis]|nr:phospholipid phosphatase 6-like isoform X2 [Pseudomyrmex gracilis]XP_020281560.1 phospholipid phosphatase 6-like isoform X2 [Pseudomyrmex gracilis]